MERRGPEVEHPMGRAAADHRGARAGLLGVNAIRPSSAGNGSDTNVAGVQWGDYADGLKVRIDGEAASHDCTGLQGEFDTADANNAATMTRTGHNNADLMGYIDAKMQAAGCH
jgi:hypothetical protein